LLSTDRNTRFCTSFFTSIPDLFFSEGHGDLWLVAATGAALSVPYHLLLMSPTNPYLPRDSFPGAEAASASALGTPASNSRGDPPAAASLASDKLPGDTEGVFLETNQANNPYMSPRRPVHGSLIYSPSGVLVPPEVAAGSWTKRYWFGAALSCASFGAMMAILASKRDMAAFVAPF
jgi:hypothetical protein